MRWTNVACSVFDEAMDQPCHEARHKDHSSSFAILMHSSSTQQLRPDSAEQDGQHGTALCRYLSFKITLLKSRSSWFRLPSIRHSFHPPLHRTHLATPVAARPTSCLA